MPRLFPARILVLLLLSTLAHGAEQKEDPIRTFALAYGAYKDGLDTLAEEQFRGFVERFPKHERACEAWFLLGEILCRNGRREDGLAAYERVYSELYACPMASDARMRAASELRGAGDLTKASALLLGVLRTAPPALACEAGLQACDLFLTMENWTELERTARTAAASCPTELPTATFISIAHAGMGRHKEAVDEATRALDRVPGPAERRKLLLVRGESHYKLGAIQLAVKDLEPALKTEPSPNGDLLLALARLKIGPAQAALEAVDRLGSRHPTHPRLADLRRLLLEALAGDLQDRALLRRELAALEPGALNPETVLTLAASMQARGWQPETTDLLSTCQATACALRQCSVWLSVQRPERALAVAEGLKGVSGSDEDERRILLAAALIRLDRSEEAIAIYGDVADSAATVEAGQRALLLQAQLYAELKRWPEATVSLQSMLIRGPGPELGRPARLLLAEAYLKSGQTARGATVLQELEAMTDGTLRIEILQRLAHAHLERGDYSNAVEALNKLVDLLTPGSPEWGRSLLDLGTAYLRMGASEQGRSVLQAAARQLPPSSPQAREILLGIAALYAGEGSYNLAAEQYQRLMPEAKTPEERGDLALRLASAYYRTERFAEAIRTLETVPPEGPQGLAALVELGLCHERLGELEKAAAAFDRLFQASSDREEAARHLLRLARRTVEDGRPELARDLFQKVLGAGVPELVPEARFELAGLELDDGAREEGLRLLQENMNGDGVDGSWASLSYLRAAAARESEQKWSEAETLYQELLRRFPDDQMAPFARGRLRQVQAQAGRPRAQEKDLADRPPFGDTRAVRDAE